MHSSNKLDTKNSNGITFRLNIRPKSLEFNNSKQLQSSKGVKTGGKLTVGAFPDGPLTNR